MLDHRKLLAAAGLCLPQEFAEFLQRDYAYLGEVVRKTGMKLER